MAIAIEPQNAGAVRVAVTDYCEQQGSTVYDKQEPHTHKHGLHTETGTAYTDRDSLYIYTPTDMDSINRHTQTLIL